MNAIPKFNFKWNQTNYMVRTPFNHLHEYYITIRDNFKEPPLPKFIKLWRITCHLGEKIINSVGELCVNRWIFGGEFFNSLDNFYKIMAIINFFF